MADAVTMLEQDHRKVEKLFAEYRNSRDPAVVREICTELKVHTTIEEEVVYPVVAKELPDGKQLDQEARKEHQEVSDAVTQIEQVGYDATSVDQLMETIIEGVTHHVQEEESEMFPKLQEELGSGALTRLGEELARAKQRATRQETGGTRVEGELASMTKDQLYQEAKKADIPGRSDMTKDELIDALEHR